MTTLSETSPTPQASADHPSAGNAMAIAFTLIETAKLNNVIRKHGSPGFSAGSLIKKSPASTNGVPLRKQRN